MPYERLLDRLIERAGFDHPVPTDLVRRLVSLDEEIQHVNAEVLLKVERRCKIQSEIAQIRADLCKLHADWRILTQTWSPSGH